MTELKRKISFLEKKSWIELFIIFFITILVNYCFSCISDDEIWIYGFSLNVANGMIPYTDFNMIVPPLYPLLQGLCMIIFGKNMFVFHFVNTLLCVGIFHMLKKIFYRVHYLLYSLLLLGSNYGGLFPGYNVLVLLLFLIIVYLEEKNEDKYDFIIGILIGLALITKQNVGILLFIPSLFFIKNFKKMINRTLGIIIPIVFMIFYLMVNKAIYEFVDYTILGLLEFTNNLEITLFSLLFFVMILYCLYQIFFLKNNRMFIKYLLFFNLISYPLFDYNHIIFPLVITLGYMLNEIKFNKKVIMAYFYILILIFIGYKLYFSGIVYINNDSNLDGRAFYNYDTYSYYKTISNKIVTYNNYYHVYIFDKGAYLINLLGNMPIDKYDLINNGNMGYKGHLRYIREFSEDCALKNCLFVIKKEGYDFGQTNQDIVDYVKENYQYKESIYNYLVYTNDYEIK